MSDYLLSSRHSPLKIGRREPGIDSATDVNVSTNKDSSSSQSTKCSTSWRKKRGHNNDSINIDSTLKYVVDMCTQLAKGPRSPQKPPPKASDFYVINVT